MKSAQVSREQTKSEPVARPSQHAHTPVTTSASSPLILRDSRPRGMRLGKTFGATQAIFPNRLQAKLAVSEPGDAYEQEADSVAERVMRMPDTTVRLQRKCACGGECEECAGERPRLQRYAADPETGGSSAPPIVRDVLRSPGQPLENSVRDFMEPRFGHDFSRVRVHTSPLAAESARAVNALSYTAGEDIVFDAGRYEPHAAAGRRLLAHELSHVIQQRGVARSIQRQEAGSGSQTTPRPPTAESQAAAEQARFDAFQRSQMAVLRRINSLLGTNFTDWFVTDEEAREVLTILQRLRRENPELLLSVVQVMRLSGRGQTFLDELPETDRGAVQDLLYTTDRNAGFIMAGDDIRLDIQGGGAIERQLSIEYNVRRDGVSLLLVDSPVQIVGMLPQDAVNAIARAYIDAQVYSEPHIRLMVTKRGAIYAPRSGPTSQSLWFESNLVFSVSDVEVQRRRKFSEFMSYIRYSESSDPLAVNARSHYHAWIEQNRTRPEFLTREPADLWRWALTQASAPAPTSPIRPFLDLAQRMHSRLSSATPEERPRLQGALNRFLAWMDTHREDPNLSRYDPVEIWAQSYQRAFQQHMREFEERFLRQASEPRPDTPEVAHARSAKFQEFYALAMQLWGFSSRTFPYRIPIDVEGRDILVTGDPARQAVFNDLARDLMNWATQHFHEDSFTTTNPRVVLADILSPRGSAAGQSPYEQRLRDAARSPLANESIDRNELMPGRVLASFGETVATGLLVIALAGAAVGLGVPAAAVGLILLGVAAYAGISSYLNRRQEIERRNYDVPVPETMLASAGDVVGLSQLIEGITGERLSTSERLTSIERSDQLGTGGGNVALLLGGSRAYRQGQLLGQRTRLSLPGRTPSGPEGARTLPPGTPPTIPEPSPRPGPLETQIRAGLREVAPTAENPRRLLPDELRMGFDDWMAEIRRNGGDPETVLGRMRANAQRLAQQQAERRMRQLLEAMREEVARRRSGDNPLNPVMQNTERVGDVTIRYNRQRPAAHEIAQAQEIASRTGEPVELFGDTASGNNYPGIDGTIGRPPRPLSLKRGATGAHGNYARWSAEEAFTAARTQGYTHVEVHIRMEGRTVAEVRAAWDAPPTQPGQVAGRAIFDSSGTISRYVIQASDGVWVVEPPLTGPALPGVGLPQGGREEQPPRP